MSFRRSRSPTLGKRKSPLSERQTLQRNLEEKRLFLRSTSSASHSRCAASPASTRLRPVARPSPPTPASGASAGDLPRVLPWRQSQSHVSGAEPSVGSSC